MSSEPHDRTANLTCLGSRYDPDSSIANADMDGIAVAVANVVMNLCLRIIVTWSPGHVDAGIQPLLVQIYTTLLSTLSSINRKQLSLFDASFALTLSSSPLTIYLVVASISNLCRIDTNLYERIKSHRLIVCVLGALVLVPWIGLSMTYGMSTKAFIDSRCYPTAFKDWLAATTVTLVFGSTTSWSGIIIPPIVPWIFILMRRLPEVRAEVKHHSKGASRLRTLWTWVKCAWCTLDHHHKWCVYYVFAYLDISWGFRVIRLAAIASGDGYVVSYGQLLSVFSAAPIFLSTVDFVYDHRLALLHFFQCLPRLCLAEARYILTGKGLDPAIQGTLPTIRDSHPTGQSFSVQYHSISQEINPQQIRRATL